MYSACAAIHLHASSSLASFLLLLIVPPRCMPHQQFHRKLPIMTVVPHLSIFRDTGVAYPASKHLALHPCDIARFSISSELLAQLVVCPAMAAFLETPSLHTANDVFEDIR